MMLHIEQKRNLTLDISKAICIILMVIGHAGCPKYLHDFVYMFHMPCFFFISGWLLSNKYLSDPKTGFIRKAKGSYYPFVKWTLIFILFHNLLASCHIYDSTYSLKTFINRILRAFTLTGSESLLGGYWFLISLFWASVVTLFFLYLLQKKSVLTNNNITGGVILILLTSSVWYLNPLPLPRMFGEQTLLATAFYLTGYLCRSKMKHLSQHSLSACLLLFTIPAIVAFFVHWNMITIEGFRVIFYYFVAISGTFGVIILSNILSEKCIAPKFAYIGSKTLYILTFHFLAFKFISFIWIKTHNLSIIHLSEPGVLKETNTWMWIIYSIAGVFLPLFLWELFHFYKGNSKK